MSYLGSWKIDDYLTFYCNTHDPDTGVATDADAVPPYRVYEDETGAAILTGNMALLDAGNTAGFYSERIQLTAASGFEKGKQYVVYISATVDTDEGTVHHTWQMEAEVDANTVSGQVTPADNSITAAKIAADAITSSELATSAVDEIVDQTWDEALAGHVGAGSTGGQLGSLPGGAAISLAVWTYVTRTLTDGGLVADAVWDELIADHQNVGSAGETLSETMVAGDAVWDEVIESGAPVSARTARQLLRIIASALAGQTAGVGDWSALSLDETKTRIAGTLDASGHRTNITVLDGS